MSNRHLTFPMPEQRFVAFKKQKTASASAVIKEKSGKGVVFSRFFLRCSNETSLHHLLFFSNFLLLHHHSNMLPHHFPIGILSYVIIASSLASSCIAADPPLYKVQLCAEQCFAYEDDGHYYSTCTAADCMYFFFGGNFKFKQ